METATRALSVDLAYLRIWHILGDPNASPPLAPLLPISRSAWWAGVKAGKYPKPVKLGPRTTAWRAGDIQDLLRRVSVEVQP